MKNIPLITEQIRSSLVKLEMALAVIEEAILWTNAQGQVMWCNAAFDHVVNKPHIECLNKNIVELLPLIKNDNVVDWSDYPVNPMNIDKKNSVEFYSFNQHALSLKLNFTTNALNVLNETTFVTVIKNITAQKQAEEKLNILHNQLLIASRQAGMADIATNVVHSIGNMLNSVNVSIFILKQQIEKSEAFKPNQGMNKLLQQHENNLGAFTSNGPHEEKIFQYLKTWIEILANEKAEILLELDDLERNVSHITHTVSAQQSLTRSIGIIENTVISDVIEDAIKINSKKEYHSQIEIIRQFTRPRTAEVDRIKLLQIMVNLIENSLNAILENTTDEKKIILSIKEKDTMNFMIQVTDTGVGIPHENITKIFSYGFTTKIGHNGFGLHSSANLANEMGGSLVAESGGLGKGAVFTLILPYHPNLHIS